MKQDLWNNLIKKDNEKLPMHFCFKQILSKPQSSSTWHSGGISIKLIKIINKTFKLLLVYFTFAFNIRISNKTTWTIANCNMIWCCAKCISSTSTTVTTWINTFVLDTSFIWWTVIWCPASFYKFKMLRKY